MLPHLRQTIQDFDFGFPEPPPIGSDLSDWKKHVAACRQIVTDLQRSKVKGWVVAEAQTRFIDTLIAAMLEHIEADYFRRYPRVDTRLAFIAQGGYGRGEMSPRSDIDLLFIFPHRATPYVEFVSEKMLYTLWDLGFHIGHATRNIPDCIRYAHQDVTVRTALLDHRYVAGDREVYEEFSNTLNREVLFHKSGRFVDAKLKEAQQRHIRFGNSTNVVEPHVKEGEGGLRDLHTALWVSKVKYKVDDFAGLYRKGLLPRSDLDALERGWDFLLRVRHELHQRTGKKHDVINFELMAPIAEALGFKGRQGTLPAEALMQRYYYHARMILHVSKGILERSTDTAERRMRDPLVRAGIKDFGHGFRAYRDELIIGEGALRENPANIMRAFRLSQKYRIPFARSSYELLRRAAGRINRDFRVDPEVNRLFLEIIGAEEGVAETLLRMNDTRILGQYIPEFGKLFCRMQYQLYHRYTVDVHSCFTVREVEKLLAGEASTPEFYRSVALRIPDRPLLMLSALFHDIGKGRGQDHSILGARLVRGVGRRMGLEQDRIDRLSLLVRHHLTMTNVAQRRDLEDPSTINEFAQDVGDAENLDLLYVLTYADTRAVGPNVWNDWKSQLLTELYERTRWVLETGDFKGRWLRETVKNRKAAVVRLAEEEASKLPVKMLMSSMPSRYFMNNKPDQVLKHLNLLATLGDSPFLLWKQEGAKGVTEVVFIGYDRPGLFSMVSGSFRACDMTIVDAQINVLNDGRVLDIYRVAPSDIESITDAKWKRLHELLDGSLTGRINLAALIAEKSSRPSIMKSTTAEEAVRIKPPRVEIDNQLSDRFTIIDIFAYDKLGLLYEITRALAEFGLTIHLAKVATAADMVADVFYVCRVGGGKVTGEDEVRALRERIMGIVASTGGGAVLPQAEKA